MDQLCTTATSRRSRGFSTLHLHGFAPHTSPCTCTLHIPLHCTSLRILWALPVTLLHTSTLEVSCLPLCTVQFTLHSLTCTAITATWLHVARSSFSCTCTSAAPAPHLTRTLHCTWFHSVFWVLCARTIFVVSSHPARFSSLLSLHCALWDRFTHCTWVCTDHSSVADSTSLHTVHITGPGFHLTTGYTHTAPRIHRTTSFSTTGQFTFDSRFPAVLCTHTTPRLGYCTTLRFTATVHHPCFSLHYHRTG